MADQEQRDDLTMEGYFNEGLADGAEPNNPFEVLEPEQPRKKRNGKQKNNRGRRNIQRNRILIAAGAAAVLILALVIAIIVRLRKNDGARYALKLSENIGQPVSSAAKNAGVSLADSSHFSTLNKLYASYQGMAESAKTCRIQGVKLPEWAIFCNTDVDELTNVTYYNYALLEKNIFGTVRKSYLDPNLVDVGAAPDRVQEQLDLVPYRIQYLEGKTELREYRYCYEDGDSEEIVSYVITAVWDESGKLKSISDTRRNYIGTLLASPEL
ncbi:MAG: hypothetical protein MJ065_07055 [Oscillospiraceae bacterium]|nr:hypothetical protein [Oscillospiraceae bacterium]